MYNMLLRVENHMFPGPLGKVAFDMCINQIFSVVWSSRKAFRGPVKKNC